MRILFVNHAFPGTFGALAAAFAAGGHEVLFASGFRRRDFTLAGVRHVVLASSREARAGGSSRYAPGLEGAISVGSHALHAFRRLGESGMAPDMIVLSASDGYGLFCEEAFPHAFRVGWAEGAKAFLTEKARGEPTFTRHLLQCRHALSSHLVLCPGTGERSLFSSRLAHGRDVPCPVNTGWFSPGEKRRPELVLFHAGRDGAAEDLTMVAGLLTARGTCRAAVLCDGPSVREQWMQACAALSEKSRPYVPGQLSLEEYRSLLRGASLVMFPRPDLPSSVLLEAMSCGVVPVLPEGAGPSFLHHGKNAFFFRPGEESGRFLSALLDGELASVQDAARRDVLARFEQKNVTALHMKLLLDEYARWKNKGC